MRKGKKLVTVIAGMLAVFGLAACSGRADTSEESSSSSSAKPSQSSSSSTSTTSKPTSSSTSTTVPTIISTTTVEPTTTSSSEASTTTSQDTTSTTVVHTHTLEKITGAVAACELAGYKDYYHCSSCEKNYEDQAATIEINNLDAWKSSTGAGYIAATGHNKVKQDGKTATKTESGYKEYYKCSVCNKCFDAEDNYIESIDAWKAAGGAGYIPVVVHDLTVQSAKAATCTESGYKPYYYCAICNLYYEDENEATLIGNEAALTEWKSVGGVGYIAPNHHIESVDGEEATCTESGYKTAYKCTVCNLYFEDQAATISIGNEAAYEAWKTAGGALAKTSHHIVSVSGMAATCLEPGYKAAYKCTSCNTYFEDQAGTIEIGNEVAYTSWKNDINGGCIPELDHSMTKVNQQHPTCTESGYKEYYKCTLCNKYFEDIDGSVQISNLASWKSEGGAGYLAPSHTLVLQAKLEATCETPGVKEYYECSVCNLLFEDSNASVAITDFDVWSTTGNGYIAPSAHSLGYTFKLNESCTKAGHLAYKTCGVCGKSYDSSNTLIGDSTALAAWLSVGGAGYIAPHHTIQKIDGLAPTASEAGYKDYYQCTVCSKYFEDLAATFEISNLTEWKSSTGNGYLAPTGVFTFTTYPEVDGTCDSAGHKAYVKCNEDGKYYTDSNRTEEISDIAAWLAVGGAGYIAPHHVLPLEVVTGAASTCTVNGYKDAYKCTSCNKYFEDTNGASLIGDEAAYNTWKTAGGKLSLASHTMTRTPSVSATCKATGIKEYWTCSKCNLHYSTSNGSVLIGNDAALATWKTSTGVIPTTDHNYIDHPQEDATYQKSGLKQYYQCSYCGTYFESDKQTVISNFEAWKSSSGAGYIAQLAKETPTYTTPTGLTAKVGQALSQITLPEGFTFEGDTSRTFTTAGTITTIGSDKITVSYKKPNDTEEKYRTVTGIEVSIEVSPADGSITTKKALIFTYSTTGIKSDLDGSEYFTKKGGEASYAYCLASAYNAESPSWISGVPANAGSYKLKVSLAASSEYSATSGIFDLTINKADIVASSVHQSSTNYIGQLYSDIVVSANAYNPYGTFTVNNGTTKITTTSFTVNYTFTPNDTSNYNSMSDSLTIVATQLTVTINLDSNCTSAKCDGNNVTDGQVINVDYNSSVTFTFEAAEGYEVGSIKDNDISKPGASSYEVSSIKSNRTITPVFKQIKREVAFTVSGSGKVYSDQSFTTEITSNPTVEYNGSYTFYVKANDGYYAKTIKVNGSEVTLDANSSYTITGIKNEQTVTITFAENPVIRFNSNANGTIISNGKNYQNAETISVQYNSTYAYGISISAYENYYIKTLTINGSNITTGFTGYRNSYIIAANSITNLKDTYVIEVIFAANPTLTVEVNNTAMGNAYSDAAHTNAITTVSIPYGYNYTVYVEPASSTYYVGSFKVGNTETELTDSAYSFVAENNETITIDFVKKPEVIFSISENGTLKNASDSATITNGTRIAITPNGNLNFGFVATPNENYTVSVKIGDTTYTASQTNVTFENEVCTVSKDLAILNNITSDITIEVTFVIKKLVSVTVNAHGHVEDASGNTITSKYYSSGEAIKLIAKADAQYFVSSYTVNGHNDSNPDTTVTNFVLFDGIVENDITIDVTFSSANAELTFAITGNGTVSASDGSSFTDSKTKVPEGVPYEFKASPTTGYSVQSVILSLNGEFKGEGAINLENGETIISLAGSQVVDGYTISITFVKNPELTVNITGNGTVNSASDGTGTNYSSAVSFVYKSAVVAYAIPDDGYYIYKVNNVEVNSVEAYKVIDTDLTEDKTISVEFKAFSKISFNVTGSGTIVSDGISYSSSKPIVLDSISGYNKSIVITAADGNYISSLSIGSDNITTGYEANNKSYTIPSTEFVSLSNDITINVEFSNNPKLKFIYSQNENNIIYSAQLYDSDADEYSYESSSIIANNSDTSVLYNSTFIFYTDRNTGYYVSAITDNEGNSIDYSFDSSTTTYTIENVTENLNLNLVFSENIYKATIIIHNDTSATIESITISNKYNYSETIELLVDSNGNYYYFSQPKYFVDEDPYITIAIEFSTNDHSVYYEEADESFSSEADSNIVYVDMALPPFCDLEWNLTIEK